jgi:hypothetical protein
MMATDKNKVSETLEVPLENWNELVRENRRLRQERDELVGALEAEYERLESKCNEDDARGRDSYWVRHYRDFQRFLLKQVSKHKPE